MSDLVGKAFVSDFKHADTPSGAVWTFAVQPSFVVLRAVFLEGEHVEELVRSKLETDDFRAAAEVAVRDALVSLARNHLAGLLAR